MNKDGQLVLAGRVGQALVKIYEARSATHAAFIHAVSRHPTAGSLFPQVLAVEGSVVVAEWIDGTPAVRDVDRIVGMQLHLHVTALADLPSPGFDYWHDYLEPRFTRALRVLSRSAEADTAIQEVRRSWNEGARTLMNPDVTSDNLILDRFGCLKVVDTGDLTSGGLPMLDVLNTAHALPPKQRMDYVNRYFARRPAPLSRDHLRALNAAWLARVVGAHYVAGRLDRAEAVMDAFSNGKSILPVDLGGHLS